MSSPKILASGRGATLVPLAGTPSVGSTAKVPAAGTTASGASGIAVVTSSSSQARGK
jgi:hypothetical protein